MAASSAASRSPKPIYALADSSLLFWKQAEGESFVEDVVQSSGVRRPSVAYIGASNGDNAIFFHAIFQPAFEQAETGERRMIPSHPDAPDVAFLERADIILLAGGSVELGWRTFAANGFQSVIRRRYLQGAVLIGISAGAVQLGRGGLSDDGSTLLETFAFLPFYVGAHEEREEWKSLIRVLSLHAGQAVGIGIPSGGGLVYHGGEVVPIRKALHEISSDSAGCQETMVVPMTAG